MTLQTHVPRRRRYLCAKMTSSGAAGRYKPYRCTGGVQTPGSVCPVRKVYEHSIGDPSHNCCNCCSSSESSASGKLSVLCNMVVDMPTEVTPASVLALKKPTEGYLCPLNANVYGLEFLEFEIKDYESDERVFRVARDPDDGPIPEEIDPELEEKIRTVKYNFSEAFLKFRTIRTLLKFQVGEKPINDLRMIERHFFNGKPLRTYDFKFGFCIPNSTNTWEAIYSVPENSPETIAEYVNHPGGHTSDSFYFAGNHLIMHNKAEYTYMPERFA